jgi:hypothetical protein
MAMVRKGLLGCLVLVLACLGLATMRQVVRRGTTRAERIDMLDLMLDVSPFPEAWERCVGPIQQPEHVRPERGARESWFVGFCPSRSERFEQGIDGAEHDVFRYGDPLEAATVFYGTFLREDFSNRYTTSPWSVPEGWSYESDAADGFRFACAEIESLDLRRRVMTCLTIAQYGEYVSSFSTTLEPEYMTLEQLKRVLVAIDERMAQQLGKVD